MDKSIFFDLSDFKYLDMNTQKTKQRIAELAMLCKTIDGKMNSRFDYIQKLEESMKQIRDLTIQPTADQLDYSGNLIVLQNERDHAMKIHRRYADDLDSAFAHREKLIAQLSNNKVSIYIPKIARQKLPACTPRRIAI